MEARLLADVLKTDTHVRVQVAEELMEWIRNEENEPEAFPDLERLIAGLSQWMGSSNFKVVATQCGKERGREIERDGCHYLE